MSTGYRHRATTVPYTREEGCTKRHGVYQPESTRHCQARLMREQADGRSATRWPSFASRGNCQTFSELPAHGFLWTQLVPHFVQKLSCAHRIYICAAATGMILVALAYCFAHTQEAPQAHSVHAPVAQNMHLADPLKLSGVLDSGHYIEIIMPRSATEEEILTMLKERCEAGGVTDYGDILGLTARLVAMKNGYERTRYWFERGGAKITFSTFLGSLADIAQDYAVSVLEIGSFEGGSALWFAQHLLKHPQSRMICLDTWEGSPEFADVDMSAVEDRFKWNMARTGRDQRIQPIKGDSMLSLSTLVAAGQSSSFDVIYVDASHRMADALADCLFAFRLLKVGGTLIVDDEIRFPEVAEATDALERALGNGLEIFQRKEQLVAKKVAGRFASQGLVALRELGDVAVESVVLPE